MSKFEFPIGYPTDVHDAFYDDETVAPEERNKRKRVRALANLHQERQRWEADEDYEAQQRTKRRRIEREMKTTLIQDIAAASDWVAKPDALRAVRKELTQKPNSTTGLFVKIPFGIGCQDHWSYFNVNKMYKILCACEATEELQGVKLFPYGLWWPSPTAPERSVCFRFQGIYIPDEVSFGRSWIKDLPELEHTSEGWTNRMTGVTSEITVLPGAGITVLPGAGGEVPTRRMWVRFLLVLQSLGVNISPNFNSSFGHKYMHAMRLEDLYHTFVSVCGFGNAALHQIVCEYASLVLPRDFGTPIV